MFIKDLFTFLIGCCFGSFINVIIYRIPLGKSVVFPFSHCVKCGYKIRWHENIPIISWIFLGGRCAKCKEQISLIYPIVELSTGFLFAFYNYSFPPRFPPGGEPIAIVCGWIFISILLTMAILDIKYLWLPENICKFGILISIISSVILTIKYENLVSNYLIAETIIATFLGYLIFQIISEIGFRIYKKPVMGKGDAKLSALIGSWLGLKGLCLSIWLSFFFSGIFVILGILSRKIKKGQKIPFGSFLSLSGLVVWYFGNDPLTNLIFLGR